MATPSRSASGSSSTPGAAYSSGSDSPYSFRIWYRIIPLARSRNHHCRPLLPPRAPHDSTIGATASASTSTAHATCSISGPLARGSRPAAWVDSRVRLARGYSERWSEEDEAGVRVTRFIRLRVREHILISQRVTGAADARDPPLVAREIFSSASAPGPGGSAGYQVGAGRWSTAWGHTVSLVPGLAVGPRTCPCFIDLKLRGRMGLGLGFDGGGPSLNRLSWQEKGVDNEWTQTLLCSSSFGFITTTNVLRHPPPPKKKLIR